MRTVLGRTSPLLGFASIIVLLVSSLPAAQDSKKSANTAATPAPRMGRDGMPDPGWIKRHEGFVEIAKKGHVDVLFLGDSITDGWRGQEAWRKHFEPLKAANFGIGGDRTQHVLWRIQNGELEGISPKVAVLMIGTNNSNGDDNTAEEIAEGITAIVKTLREKPHMKVLLLAVFPRADKREDVDKVSASGLRTKIADVNQIIAKLDDGKMVRYLDIGPKFLDADGGLSKEIMPDFLHLSPKGYEIWAEAIKPLLTEMMSQ